MSDFLSLLGRLEYTLFQGGELGPLIGGLGLLAAIVALVLLVRSLARGRRAFGQAALALGVGTMPLLVNAAKAAWLLPQDIVSDAEGDFAFITVNYFQELDQAWTLALVGLAVPALVAILLAAVSLARLPPLPSER